MKGRIALWSVIGLMVIAGVIFLTSPCSRPLPGVTLEKVKSDAATALRQADGLSARLAELEKSFGPAGDPTGNVANARQFIAEGRGLLEKAASATESKSAVDDLSSAKQSFQKARRALKLAGKSRQPPRGF